MKITHDGEVQSEKISAITPAEHEDRNRKTVKTVYKALLRGGSGDTETLEKLVSKEIEWWYHGPPHCHHMVKALTGESTHHKAGSGFFRFRPRRMRAIGYDRVIVEGWEGIGEYWVHAWGLNEDGIIYQLREYFNTLVTIVVRESNDDCGGRGGGGDDEVRLWRSTPWARAKRSLPGLVLTI